MNLLNLIIEFPLLGFITLLFFQGRKLEKQAHIISISSIGITVLLTILEKLIYFKNKNTIFEVTVFNWININNLNIPITFVLDNLSLTMIFTIVLVGLLICLYSSWYMKKEKNYARFFLYINLFITGMLILVLTNNLLIMYLGMELIGFCSYLLIGFNHESKKCGKSSTKAFILTKIGDICILFAIFFFYNQFGTLNYNSMSSLISKEINKQSIELTTAIFMLFIGFIGKSAQIPLHTWLSDAMSGPTPASALIHSSTMVTSGVYLTVRLKDLFFNFSEILTFIEIISITVIILSSLSAMFQTDIKKILAYSTMSQIGYMFLSISINAFNIAIYHLFTHAFFKSLLFLSSGSISNFCNKERNINKIGNLKNYIPFIKMCFLFGSASLSSFPIVTSGFYSKDEILLFAFINGHKMAYIFGLIGSFLTSIYVSRMIFFVLFSKKRTSIGISNHSRTFNHYFSLTILLLFSTFFGKCIIRYLMNELDIYNIHKYKKIIFELIAITVSITGYLSFFVYLKNTNLFVLRKPKNYLLFQILFRSFCFDILYNLIFVKPYLLIVNILKNDPVDKFINFILIKTNDISKNFFKVEKKEFLSCTYLITIWSTLVTIILVTSCFTNYKF